MLSLLFAVAILTQYRFSNVVSGAYPTVIAGRLVTDGTHCRIDFDRDRANVPAMTSVVCGDNGELIALNDTNKTWYRLKSRTRLATSSPLFDYFGATVSKLKVTSDPDGRVKFSYRLDFVTGGEHVSGEVWAEIKITTADAAHKARSRGTPPT